MSALIESMKVFDAMRSLPPDPARGRTNLLPLGWNAAGVRVDADTALQVSAVWACIDVLSKAIASSPWNVYETLPDGDRDLRANDPLMYVLNTRPNPDVTAIAFRRALMIAATAWGNGYAEIVRDAANRVAELWLITPDRVTPRRRGGELVYEVRNDDGTKVDLDAADVLHVRGPGIEGYLGDNVITKAARSIALSIAQERFSEAYFGNNAQLGGILEVPGQLDDTTYERMKQQWSGRHQGPSKAFRVGFIEAGMKWHEVDVKAEDAQLTEARQTQVEEICRWFGVPPHKIQHLIRATFNNIEHLGIEFVRDGLRPWAMELQQEADYKLMSRRGPPRFTLIDLEWASQGDFKSRAEGYQIMRNIGAYSVNDVLRKEGQNTIGEEGDIRIVNSAATRLEDVGKNLTPAKAAPQMPDAQGDAVRNICRAGFLTAFNRFAAKRETVVETAERNRRPESVEAWARAQGKYISENVMPLACALSALIGADVSDLAIEQGRKVIAGELSATDAAAALVDNVMRKSA